MTKKTNGNVDVLQEIKTVAGVAGEQLASKDYEGAWTTIGKLNAVYKEHGDLVGSQSTVASEALRTNIKNYYYQNKKLNSATYGLEKIGQSLIEVASMIKVEK